MNVLNFVVDTELSNVSANSRLIDFIRDKAGLTGTKSMCREGGCGICIVSVRSRDPNSGKELTRAVNSVRYEYLLKVALCIHKHLNMAEN